MYQKLISFLFALTTAVAVSCTKSQNLTPVHVSVEDFLITIDTFSDTKTTVAPENYNGVKALTLAFHDSENTETYKSTQLKTDDGFGEFSLALVPDTYTMVVVGYGIYDDEVFTLTSPTVAGFTTDCRETFVATQEVTVSGTAAVELSATLDRIVAKLMVISTDGRPEGVARIRMGFSAGNKSFNPSTGLATSNTSFSNSVGISAPVGDPTSSVCYLFLSSDEQNINVTIDALDADNNVLFERIVPAVPFQRNRCTKLTGSVYSVPASAGSFLLNKDWEDDYEQSF